jgi:hypothetical protein
MVGSALATARRADRSRSLTSLSRLALFTASPARDLNPHEEQTMQKSMLVFAMLSAATFAASAQTKISGKLACGKPEVNSSAEIPDAAGHMMMVSKASCTWPTSIDIGGAKTKTAIDVATAEVHGASGTQHGYSVAIMDNGDKATASYSGTLQLNKDGSGTFKGTWKYTSGTGKLKGIKGSGTYTGSATADGSATGDVEGEYTLPAPAAKKGM